MTVTLNPTCPLCGLRYASRPMLELHIREDHRQRAAPNQVAHPAATAWHPGRPSPGRR